MPTGDKHDKPCPNCGHCPTCGRSNFRPWYPNQWWYGYPQWVYPYTTGDFPKVTYTTGVGIPSWTASGGSFYNAN